MAVISNTFGSTTLTEADAKKFKDQITYGRPKAEAREALERGAGMSEALRQNKRLVLRPKG